MQIGVRHIQRRVGLQFPATRVVGGGDGSGLSALGGAQSFGRNRLQQRRPTELDRSVDHIK